MSGQTYVVIGGGLAGAKAVETLRDEGFDGSIVLLAGEKRLPYERPPLSKGFLLGKDPADKATVHDEAWYAAHDVDLRLGTWADAIDVAEQTVTTEAETLHYDKLLLTTGAAPRKLRLPGSDEAPIHYLRTFANSERLKADLSTGGRRVVVVGAGWIGLEVTAAARTYGNEVTVLEPQAAPLQAALGDEMGGVFATLHRDHDVDLRLSTGVASFERLGDAWAVVDAHAHAHPADVIVVGIGARPATDLAEAAGLTVDNGVVVDASLRTSDPNVFAAGDVASAFNPLLGRHLRVEHWANALNAGPGRSAGDARAGRDLRPGAVLLLRPVRPGHGVLRSPRGLHPGGDPRRRRRSRVRGVLARRRGPRPGRDERQRLGRQRPDPGAGPQPSAGGRRPPVRPRGDADGPRRWLTRSRRSAPQTSCCSAPRSCGQDSRSRSRCTPRTSRRTRTTWPYGSRTVGSSAVPRTSRTPGKVPRPRSTVRRGGSGGWRPLPRSAAPGWAGSCSSAGSPW